MMELSESRLMRRENVARLGTIVNPQILLKFGSEIRRLRRSSKLSSLK
jgi:hypothetical protein